VIKLSGLNARSLPSELAEVAPSKDHALYSMIQHPMIVERQVNLTFAS
jgi:hypothetical protein